MIGAAASTAQKTVKAAAQQLSDIGNGVENRERRRLRQERRAQQDLKLKAQTKTEVSSESTPQASSKAIADVNPAIEYW